MVPEMDRDAIRKCYMEKINFPIFDLKLAQL